MTDFLNYVQREWGTIFSYTLEHLQLVGIAIVIAILIGVPLGIYLTTNKYLAETILQVASIIITIPSIALFGIMIPVLSMIGQGIGFLPALIALVLYSQLPIIRNTYTAIQNVDPNIRDAAKGIGMTTFQRLTKVEIPNALPLIMAGVRTATVLNIGIGAIAAFIGSGGLGVLINSGISRGNSNMVLAGAVFVSLLALVADFILKFIQARITPKGIK
ncbi:MULTISPECIES: ABC transporter permease [Halobacillus]|uniref:Osmoprotectant transport system permease protein n=3 Tax=Halobacillus TaxID=45667 RepID=A0A1H0LJ72_HALAD|nr:MULTISPECIES: ABC transporter permease [Halobacillus]REJ10389.1 ABC transporter permease [Halobacillus trueperi]SDO68071.1 osmoprotectant transport system permease protein [Halobacillus aidingensis]